MLVARDGKLVAVPATGETLETMDSTRRLGRLAEGGDAEEIGDASAIDRMRTRAFAALALEAVGMSQRALELSVEHAKTREQFGKPIGIYQAVSHRLADSYALTELARSLAYWAAWCVAEEDDEAPVAAAAAKAYAGDVAVNGLRVLDPGARRHRLHLGARAPPLLQAGAVDPGLRRLSRPSQRAEVAAAILG